MKTCTFFGHRDSSEELKPALRQAIIELIEKEGVGQFYVGSQGAFDRMALSVLKELAERYPIRCEVVLAYLDRPPTTDHPHTVYPEGLEQVPLRFSIDRRNRWMLEQSDYAVVYLRRSFGGAAKFATLAEQKGKTIIRL